MSKLLSDKEELREEDRLQAAEWLARLEDPHISPERYSEWLQWTESDSRHQRAFDEMARLAGLLEERRNDLAAIPLPDSLELKRDRYIGTVPVEAWIADVKPASNGSAGRHFLAAAAVAVMALGATFYAISKWNGELGGRLPYSLETAASQHDEAMLYDGSKIDIGAHSALTVNFSQEQRTVVLERGEALFSVAKDAKRPFVVVAGSGTITAIGTEFNVRRDSERVVVTVTEGTVEVSSQIASSQDSGGAEFGAPDGRSKTAATLDVGEQVVYDSLGLADVSAADPVAATSWREGRLQYLREPLQYVVTGINRYSDLTIVIADDEVNDLLFTGTVFDGQSREWLEGLANVLPVQVEFVGSNTALLTMKSPH